MKKFLTILITLCFVGLAHADMVAQTKTVQSALTSAKSTTLAVDKTATIYTLSFPIQSASIPMAIMYTSNLATADTAIYFEQSFRKPTTEGSSDVAYIVTDIINATNTGTTQWYISTIDTVEMMYGRFKIVGQNSNPATTTLQIKVVK